MPVTQSNLSVVDSWTSSVANTGGFGSRTQGPDRITFTQANLNLTTFNQEYNGGVTIPVSGSVTINLTNCTNLNSETINFAHLLSITVIPSDSVQLTTQSANPILWFFSSASDSIPVNALFAYSEKVTDPGYQVTAAHKTFQINNLATGSVTVDLGIKGGTA